MSKPKKQECTHDDVMITSPIGSGTIDEVDGNRVLTVELDDATQEDTRFFVCNDCGEQGDLSDIYDEEA